MNDNKMVSIGALIGVFLIVTLIIFYVFVAVKYANTPVSEMPVWVWWLLGGGRK